MTAPKRRALFTCHTLHRKIGLAGVLSAAVLITSLPVAADPAANPAHTIADRFAQDSQRAEAAREAQRKDAARKQAQQRKEDAAKAAQAKARKAHEAEMLARARAEVEERRQLEIEAARLDAIRAEREAKEVEAERRHVEKQRQIDAAREAEQTRIAEEARKAEESKRAAEAQRVAAEKAAAEIARKAEEAARLADAERKADEARQAEHAARAAEEARRADLSRKAEEIRKADDIRKANEALRLAAERAAADDARRAEAEKRDAEARRAVARATAEEMRRVTDIEADAEIARVAERLARIRAEHLKRHSGAVEERTHEPSSGRGRMAESDGSRDVPLQPPRQRADVESRQRADDEPTRSDPKLYAPDMSPRDAFDGHVTVVLQMEPRYRRGRRYESMDPVLCVAGGCYVSNGAEHPATFLHGHRAIRFGNAIGRRAGDCNSATTCVFRNVDLGALPAEIQPVDIRVLRHDLRAAERVQSLSTCRIAAGDRLACTGAIQGDGFTMLVISEDLAERLPPHAFDGVLAGGFSDNARADADLWAPRRRW